MFWYGVSFHVASDERRKNILQILFFFIGKNPSLDFWSGNSKLSMQVDCGLLHAQIDIRAYEPLF